MPVASTGIQMSPDGQYILATGMYAYSGLSVVGTIKAAISLLWSLLLVPFTLTLHETTCLEQPAVYNS